MLWVTAVAGAGTAGGPAPAPPPRASGPAPPTPDPAPEPASPTATTLLVWGHGGLPDEVTAGLDALEAVEAVSVVAGDRVDIIGTTTADGDPVLELPVDWAVPLDAQALDPDAHAPFVSPRTARALDGLVPGTVLLSQPSAELRDLDAGDRIVTANGNAFTVAGIVPAEEVGWAEIVMDRADPSAIDHLRYALVRTTDARAAEAAVRELVDEELRVIPAEQARFLRHGDAAVPPLALKQAYGEFAIRDVPGRWLQLGATWRRTHLKVADVPLLGRVECHVEMIAPLRAAMQELVDRGRGDAIDPDRYLGCWAGRVIGASRTLSHHSWGIAIDLNVDPNDPYDASSMDPVVVEVMKDHGFIWGGDFLRPDPPHFELAPDTAR